MKKTLQDQYLLIKEGKGHIGVFLTEAKRQFPNIVRNAATFDEAVASLKTKNIISENVFSVMPAIMDRPKKESYETAFEAFLAEVKKKDEDEKVKAEEKKVSKPVEEDLAHNYDNSDDKNPDNMIFDQIMTGYYAEMKDPKNADKTMQELKDIVFKNLAKDPIYYTKNGQFGVKDLGYTTEAPGLGEPKEAKGKYKSSGYGDLKESKEAKSEKESEEMIDLQSKLMQLGVNAMVVDAIAKSKGIQGLRDRLKEKLKEGEEYYDGDDEEVKDVRDMSWTKGFTKEEQTLREVVRKMIAEELNEISLGVVDNDIEVKSSPVDLPISYSDDKNVAHYSDDYEYSSQDDLLDIEDYLDQIAGMSKGDAFDYLKEMGLERDEILAVLRNHKSLSLRESVEKDLADINKEAEHEVLQTKLDKIDALIDHRRSKLSKLDEDEDMKALTDKKKVKELEKDIKKLEVARKKVEKMMSKFKGKKAASKEVIDEVEDDEELPLETPAEASAEYLQYKEDAENRYDAGESIDSILDNYNNISLDMKNMLRDDLEGKMDGMDY
jgi:hypothetical protein